MWPWYTAEDRRQASTIVLLLAIMGVMLAGAVLIVAGPATAGVTGHGIHIAGEPGLWPHVVWRVLSEPSDPAAAFVGILPPFGPLSYWIVTVVLGGGFGGGFVLAARVIYGALAPTGTGFASRTDIAGELSPAACRKRAKVTRPELTRSQRLKGKPGEIGIPLHQAPWGPDLWLPLENATGVIAPQQSGKTMMDLIHKVLAAPAGLLVTSTKLDLYLYTAVARERAGSTVHVLDLTGATEWHRPVRWNPIRGCVTVKDARRRAHALVAATSGGTGDQAGNHAFFERRAVDVMTAYLLAAGLSGASLTRFIGWCQEDENTEAVDILRAHSEFQAILRTLQQAQAVVEETRSGIWETLRDAIACLTDPDVVESCLPRECETEFDPADLIRGGGTLFVIGSEDDGASQAPLITAFVQHVLDTARRLALADSNATGRERLSPPFTAVLDEIASICPLPGLPDTLSDSAGRGMLIHYALQSPAQAQKRWGKAAATLFDNTTALTLLGGLKSEETLKWASLLAGRRLEEKRSRQTARSWSDIGTQQIGQDRSEILEPAAIRQIPRGRALVVVRALPPMIVRLKPAWIRRDWKQLSADAANLRAGNHREPQQIAGEFIGTTHIVANELSTDAAG